MVQKIKLGICIVFAMLSLSNHWTYAQFNYEIGTGGTYGRTALTGIVRGIGIGNFTLPNVPLSALHINTNFFPVGFQTGEVFRTDCPMGNSPFWRMFRGGTEQFALYNPANTNNVILQASQKDGNLILKDYKNEITLKEIIELKKEVQELKALLANKN